MYSTSAKNTNPGNKRRRLLSHTSKEDADVWTKPAKRPFLAQHQAKLVTQDKAGLTQEIYIAVDRPVVVGRHKTCTYIIPDRVVSNSHFKIYAMRSNSGGIVLSCMDTSTNGTVWNTHLIKNTPIILSHGDVLEIPQSKTFEVLIEPEESNVYSGRIYNSSQVVKNLDRYLVTEHSLGSGTFGTVKLAIDELKHCQVACKTIFTGASDGRKGVIDSRRLLVMKEVRILEALRHPNINRILDVFPEQSQVHIFLELCTGGDLLQFIDQRGKLNEAESKYLGYQLMQGLEYLHSREISHRDIKPENILIYAPGPYPRIMLADFGYARNQSRQTSKSICGTISYVPPEALLNYLAGGKKHHLGAKKDKSSGGASDGFSGLPFDCWSLGVCLYFMLSGGHPFDYGFECSQEQSQSQVESQQPQRLDPQASTNSEHVIKERITMGTVEFNWSGWSQLPAAKHLVSGLLQPKPKNRTTIREALASHWISKERLELEKLYTKRISSVYC